MADARLMSSLRTGCSADLRAGSCHDCAKNAAIGSICSHGARRRFLQIAWQEDAMLGVRFSAVCGIVLGGMLVSSAAHAAQTCDQRSARACKPAATQSNREAPRA